jgi:hypothetical protein
MSVATTLENVAKMSTTPPPNASQRNLLGRFARS